MPNPQSPSFSRRFLWRARYWLAAGVLLLAVFAWWHFRQDASPAAKPLITKVEKGNIENTVAAAGSLAPGRSVDVGAQVSGQLESLAVDVGEVVSEGQLLASIDASVQMQRVEASRASLQAQEALLSGRKAALELAEANVKRQKNMLVDRATSQQEVDTAINALMNAQSSMAQLQAQIAQSRAGLASDEAELGYSKIVAPMAGTVVSINVKEGQTLNAAQSAPLVMTIADLTNMTVETDVSEADVGKLKPGMAVYFTTLGNGHRRWYGKLRQILPTPEVTNNVVLYTALFDVENKDGTLLSGMTAQVFFVTSSARDVLTVPMAALSHIRPLDDPSSSEPAAEPAAETPQKPAGYGGNGGYKSRRAMASGAKRQAEVTVIDNKGNKQERTVVIGVSSRVQAEVVSGLQAGEQVVSGIVDPMSGSAGARDGRPMGMRGFR
ncbi:efflux RND transporter periplasmic adaptor subunit [Teredinibacter turnerae]|uniref:efflux RND transporter periplasmic adaptor subunit n=1 Tax=Teredinibacter turnerae TaxID=2426 RepID=UPI0004264133|nr:efflux RND transporter periplasmic adaptor subunit [Teredinibacter turnerae]